MTPARDGSVALLSYWARPGSTIRAICGQRAFPFRADPDFRRQMVFGGTEGARLIPALRVAPRLDAFPYRNSIAAITGWGMA